MPTATAESPDACEFVPMARALAPVADPSVIAATDAAADVNPTVAKTASVFNLPDSDLLLPLA